MEPLRPEERDEAAGELLAAYGEMNIFATLARHPQAMKRWLVFGSHVLAKSTLGERERELLILRVGWRCGSEYEFGQHTIIGRAAGLTDDEIRRLTTEDLDSWDGTDAVLVQAADELVADHCIGDETWAALAERMTDQQVIDLLFTVGQYVMVSSLLRTLGVEREDGVPGWPS